MTGLNAKSFWTLGDNSGLGVLIDYGVGMGIDQKKFSKSFFLKMEFKKIIQKMHKLITTAFEGKACFWYL